MGEAFRDSAARAAVSDVLAALDHPGWELPSPAIEFEPEQWALAQERIDACLLHQARVWRQYSLSEAIPEAPDALAEVLEALLPIVARVGALASLVERSRRAIHFEPKFEIGRDGIAELLGRQHEPESARVLADLPGYLTRLWYRFQEPFDRVVGTYRLGAEERSGLDEARRQRFANGVANALGDVVAILSDVRRFSTRAAPVQLGVPTEGA